MFFRDANLVLHVECRDCQHPISVEELTTWREYPECQQRQSLAWHLTQAGEALLREQIDNQALKEDLHRAVSKRTSPQEAAKMAKKIRELEAIIANQMNA